MECDFCSPDAMESQVVGVVGQARLWLPRTPLTAATLMATTTRHVERVGDLTHQDAMDLLDAAQCAIRVSAEVFGTVACNFAMNDGAEAGQSTPHVHLHIWPRSVDSGLNPFRVLNRVDSPAPHIGSSDWDAARDRWREAFGRA